MPKKFERGCPFGGDTSNDCKGCAYSANYHFDKKTSKCVRREVNDDMTTEQTKLAARIINVVEDAIRRNLPGVDEIAMHQEGNTLLHGKIYYSTENTVVEMLNEDPEEEQHDKPTLRLSGKNANAFVILGEARRVARDAGWPENRIKIFMTEAMMGNYDHLLQTTMKYFDVE